MLLFYCSGGNHNQIFKINSCLLIWLAGVSKVRMFTINSLGHFTDIKYKRLLAEDEKEDEKAILIDAPSSKLI